MKIAAILLDISGVLYDGREVITGALASFRKLRDSGLPLRLVTNTATQNRRQILEKLQHMGFALTLEELITAPSAARSWLQEHQLRPFCLLHPNLHSEFAEFDQSAPNAVLLGDARDALDYAHLNQAFRLCMEGAPLIGIGMNRYFSENEKLCLDAGMFIRGIAWAANIEPLIMGKPSQAFYHQVVADLGVPAENCLMIGDDVETDVCGAIDVGLQAALVKTGKYRKGDQAKLPSQALLLDSIVDLPQLLQQNQA